MSKMNVGDKHHRITLRLNDRQFDFVRDNADFYGVSPSEYLRIIINQTEVAFQKMRASADGDSVKLSFDDIIKK